MTTSTYKNSPSVWNLLFTGGVFVAIAVYGMISLSTEDLLWFWPGFDARPDAVTVHCYGQDVALVPGTAPFSGIADLVNEGLSGYKNWDKLSMSEMTYQEYRTSAEMMAVELSYTPPVRIHSIYKFFSTVDTLVIPLDGRHADTYPVFGRNRDDLVPGSLHIETTAPLVEYLQSQALCGRS